MAKNPAEAWKNEAHDARTPMGLSASKFDNLSGTIVGAKSVAKPGSGKADPLGITGGSGHRKGVKYTASYAVKATFKAYDYEKQPTQANGRIVPATKSQSGNFYAEA